MTPAAHGAFAAVASFESHAARRLGPGTMDRSFWSGAIIVVTVVVAGAGTLPALLLRPTAPEIGLSAESQPFVPRPTPRTEPTPKLAELPKARGEPAELAQAVPSPDPVPDRVPGDVAAQALPAAPSPPAAASRPQESFPQSFPPVQAVDLPAPAGVTPSNASPPPAESVAKPVRPPREAARHPKRQVRPAPFPLREFLAWRR